MLFVCRKNQCLPTSDYFPIIFALYCQQRWTLARFPLLRVAANKDRFPSQPPIEDFPQGPLPAQRSNHGIGPCLTTIFQQSLVFSAFKYITIIRFICCKFQCCYVALVIDQTVGLGPDNDIVQITFICFLFFLWYLIPAQSMPARDQGQRVETCCVKRRRKINIEFKLLLFA